LTARAAELLLRSARALLAGRPLAAKKAAAEALRSIAKARTRARADARREPAPTCGKPRAVLDCMVLGCRHHSNVAP
jgi:hypothetical protein